MARNTLEHPITHRERIDVLYRLHEQAKSHTAPVGNIDAMVLHQCIVLLDCHNSGMAPPPDPHRKD